MPGNIGLTSLIGVSVGRVGQPAAETNLAGVTIAAGAPNSRYADTTLAGVTVAAVEQSSPNTNLAGVTVVYTVGAPDVKTSRAFGFTYDNHPFFGIHIGNEGTFVYDVSTKQWSQWQTAGYNTWNMEGVVKWNDYIVGGSIVDGSIWKLDDNAFVDEGFRAVTRTVSGGIPQRARRVQTNYGVTISAAVGDIDADSDSTINLTISDDNGKSFIDCGTIVLNNDPKQELAWQSLGAITAPGRVYYFTDVGSLRRIDDADAQIEGEDDNPDDQ